MTQNTETKTAHHPINMWPFAAVFAICAVIQFDALAAIIPNQTAALGTTPVVWGIGAVFISVKMKRENSDHLLYNSFPLSGRDGLILFFVTAGGIAMAAGELLTKRSSVPWGHSRYFYYGDCHIHYGVGFQTA